MKWYLIWFVGQFRIFLNLIYNTSLVDKVIIPFPDSRKNFIYTRVCLIARVVQGTFSRLYITRLYYIKFTPIMFWIINYTAASYWLVWNLVSSKNLYRQGSDRFLQLACIQQYQTHLARTILPAKYRPSNSLTAFQAPARPSNCRNTRTRSDSGSSSPSGVVVGCTWRTKHLNTLLL